MKAPEPPNLRKADSPKRCCENCRMFDHGKCWGFGNWPVSKNELCDNWYPDKQVHLKRLMGGKR